MASHAPVLGILVDDPWSSCASFLDVVSTEARRVGVGIVVARLEAGADPLDTAAVVMPGVDGVAMIADGCRETLAARSQIPLVLIGESAPAGTAHDLVRLGYTQAGRKVAEYIASAGRTSVLLVGPKLLESPLVDGFRAGVSIFDLQLSPIHVVAVDDRGPDVAARLDAAFSIGRTLPEAIFCTDGDVACSVYEFVRQRGFRVPEDMWIIGHGRGAMTRSPFYDVTTIAPPDRALSRSILELFLSRLRSPDAQPRVVDVGHAFCVGATTDFPPLPAWENR